MNFLEETLDVIKSIGKEEQDVLFIGTKGGKHRVDIAGFKKIANFEYDGGFGAAEIPQDLVVYFKDKTHLERAEYDGSEWWEYRGKLSLAEKYNKISAIPLNSWATYEDGICKCGKAKNQYDDLCEGCDSIT